MRSEGVTYIQCQQCGKIFPVNAKEYDVEKIYIRAHCPGCGHDRNMLSIGNDLLDKYELYDVTSDERYFIY